MCVCAVQRRLLIDRVGVGPMQSPYLLVIFSFFINSLKSDKMLTCINSGWLFLYVEYFYLNFLKKEALKDDLLEQLSMGILSRKR